MTPDEALPPVRTVTLQLKTLTAAISCGQCGEGLVYQGADDAANCPECAWQSPVTWRELLLDLFELKAKLKQHGDCHSMVLSKVKSTIALKAVTGFQCSSCNLAVEPAGEWFDGTPRCQGCATHFDVRVLETDHSQSVRVLVLPAKGPKAVQAAMSLNCSSCGGPMNSDGAARTVKCEFCHAENVVPVLAKARTVYDTVYAAALDDRTELPRDRIFSGALADVLVGLQAVRRRPLPVTQYEALMIKHRNDPAIFDELEKWHLRSPDIAVVRQLMGGSCAPVASYARGRLADLERNMAQQRAEAAKRRVKTRLMMLAPILLVVLFVVIIAALRAVSARSAD